MRNLIKCHKGQWIELPDEVSVKKGNKYTCPGDCTVCGRKKSVYKVVACQQVENDKVSEFAPMGYSNSEIQKIWGITISSGNSDSFGSLFDALGFGGGFQATTPDVPSAPTTPIAPTTPTAPSAEPAQATDKSSVSNDRGASSEPFPAAQTQNNEVPAENR